MPDSDSPNTMIAAYLTKPGNRRGVVRGRKEPLVFTKRTRRPELFAGLPPEPEDAKLTGATRSLYRRLLALNLQPEARKPVSTVITTVTHDIKIA